MSLTHVKALQQNPYLYLLPFLRQSSIPPVEYKTLNVFTTAAAPTTLLLVIPGNQGWLW